MKTITLTDEQYELLKTALDSSPVVGEANGEPGHPASELWDACARATSAPERLFTMHAMTRADIAAELGVSPDHEGLTDEVCGDIAAALGDIQPEPSDEDEEAIAEVLETWAQRLGVA